ncbi:MAG: glycosyltransferase family 2 protein [Butyrivibrio sp.]|jgi:teichuronic acid biosynthesis glycosyltransferase TuaG|nr:glycosyltransferase family 2 protein [Butyrivibrio sp.]
MVSIIVPVYNAGSYIDKTIAMVEKQTFKDWELILVDDASSDDSCARIKSTLSQSSIDPARIHLVRKERNEGAASARNVGIDVARGRYIAFLDADDVWMPEKLELELAFMKQKGAAFVFTAYEFGNEQAEPTGKVVHVPAELDFQHALSRTVIFTSTVLFDLEKISKKAIHMPDVPSEDTATWWSILKSGVTAFGYDRVLTIYRRPVRSLSSNKAEAARRIWNLYRQVAGLGPFSSAVHFAGWAIRATARRL